MQREAQAASDDGRSIAAFLRSNPGWLAAHPELYAVLDPPRRLHGEAMADHMAAMLDQARRHGTDAAAGRRAVENFTALVQDAVLALMRAPDPVCCLHNDLPLLLGIESARLSAETDIPGATPIPRGTVDLVLGQRDALVRDAGVDRTLHGEAAPLTIREALVRVPLAAAPALLAIAVRSQAGLDGAATPALTFLGRAAAAALDRV